MDDVAYLKDLQASSADVESAMLLSMDGKIMASSVKADTPDKEASAVKHCIEAMTIALDLVALTERGDLDQVYVKGQHGYVVMMAVDTTVLLVVLAREQAKLGLLY